MNTLMLAIVSGEALIHHLVYCLVIGLCLTLVYFFGKWLIKVVAAKFGASPDNATLIWMVVCGFLCLLLLLNLLLGLIDKPFMRF